MNGTTVSDLATLANAPVLPQLLAGATMAADAGTANPPTPVGRLERTGFDLELELLVKDERTGPTWSYKDRLARVAAAHAAALHAPAVVVASSGNHGAAVAHACAARGLPCVVLCTATIAPPMRALVRGVGGHLVPVPKYEDRWTVMEQAVDELDWYPAGNFHAPPIGSQPYAVDGYKAIAYEIAAQVDPCPDWIVVPVGYGDGITGIAKGFLELEALGVVPAAPRMLAAVTSSSLSDAVVAEQSPRPAAVLAPDALSIACPQATVQTMAAVVVTNGRTIVVDDDEAHEARQALSREGLFFELSAAVGLAALSRARADGVVEPGARVMLVGTSTGLKDQLFDVDRRELEVVEPTLSGMQSLVGDLVAV